MQDIMANQQETFIHFKIEGDLAYKWSVEKEDVINMQMVLRAHQFDYDFDSALSQIRIAKKLENI